MTLWAAAVTGVDLQAIAAEAAVNPEPIVYRLAVAMLVTVALAGIAGHAAGTVQARQDVDDLLTEVDELQAELDELRGESAL